MNALTQMDLWAATVIASPTPAATPPAAPRREHCPAPAPGPRKATTGDLPTLVVDGIKHLTYYVL